MSLMHNNSSPKLFFSEEEKIANGVIVQPLNFTLNKAHPPFKAAYFQVFPGCITPLDQHEVEETWIVLKGNGLLTFEENSYLITENDMLYFPSFKKHQVCNTSNEVLLICSLYW